MCFKSDFSVLNQTLISALVLSSITKSSVLLNMFEMIKIIVIS